MYLSFLVINLEGLHAKWTGKIVRCLKSNPKKHQNCFVEMPILTDGSFVHVVFSKFDSKYWNNFNCGYFSAHVNTRNGINRRILTSTLTQKIPMPDLLCYFWMGVTSGIVVGMHETFMFRSNS